MNDDAVQPRPAIQTLCEVTAPTPQDKLCDPAAGTGSFAVAAYSHVLDHFRQNLDRAAKLNGMK